MYQFKGFIPNKDDRPWFTNIFNNYLSQSGIEEVLEFGELAPYVVSDQAISRLNVLYDTGSGYPKNIGYLADTNSLVFNDVRNKEKSQIFIFPYLKASLLIYYLLLTTLLRL